MKNYVTIINVPGKQIQIIEGTEQQIIEAASKAAGMSFAEFTEVGEWINTLIPPSGIYKDAKQAHEAVAILKNIQDARLMKVARKKLDMTQVELTNALGFSNPSQDGLPIRKIEAGKVSLSGVARRFLASLLAGKVVTDKAEEYEVLNAVNHGKWKEVGMGEFQHFMEGKSAVYKANIWDQEKGDNIITPSKRTLKMIKWIGGEEIEETMEIVENLDMTDDKYLPPNSE